MRQNLTVMVNLIGTIATGPMKITTGTGLLTIKIDEALWYGVA